MALRQPKKDYLAEMKRCPHCGRVRNKERFYKDKNKAGGLQSWCKTCQYINVNACHKRKRKRCSLERGKALDQPSFIYQDGYTLNVIPIHENFKIELCDGQEEMAVLLPVGRAELLKDWLVIKLKETK